MSATETVSTALALVTGGAAVGIANFLYKVFRTNTKDKEKRSSAAEARLDPIVKSADQLSAKIRALGERDFIDLPGPPGTGKFVELAEYLNVLYLVVEFWAQIELLRDTSSYWELSRDRRGLQLQSFLRCLESREVRLVSRALQRGLGESLLLDGGRVATFRGFVKLYQEDPTTKEWLKPLTELLDLSRIGGKKARRRARQQWLQYGVVVHSLVDTLDAQHYVGRDRPGLPNKLSDRTKRDLRNRVFKLYLKEVRHPEKYLLGKG